MISMGFSVLLVRKCLSEVQEEVFCHFRGHQGDFYGVSDTFLRNDAFGYFSATFRLLFGTFGRFCRFPRRFLGVSCRADGTSRWIQGAAEMKEGADAY